MVLILKNEYTGWVQILRTGHIKIFVNLRINLILYQGPSAGQDLRVSSAKQMS